CQGEEEKDRHIAFGKLDKPPDIFLAEKHQAGVLGQCLMTRIKGGANSARPQSFLRLRLVKREFVHCDERGAEKSFQGVNPTRSRILRSQAKTQADEQKQIADRVAQCVKLAADLGNEVFRARDLAVAA